MQGRSANQKPTFGQLLNKYSKVVHQDRPLKKRSRSPPHRSGSPSLRGGPSKRRGGAVTVFPPQRAYATMPWAPPASNASNPTWEHEGVWMQCFPMPYPPYSQGESFRTLVHDRLGPRHSGQSQQAPSVRPVSAEAGSVLFFEAGISCKGEEG